MPNKRTAEDELAQTSPAKRIRVLPAKRSSSSISLAPIPYPSPPRDSTWDRSLSSIRGVSDGAWNANLGFGALSGKFEEPESDEEEIIAEGVVGKVKEAYSEESLFEDGEDDEDETDEFEDQYRGETERRARQAVRRAIYNNSYLHRHYTVSELLGWGGNGAVLGAIRNKDKKPVAIKLIYKKNETNNNVPHEIGLLLSHQFPTHPNLLRAHTTFEDNNAFYLVTERFGSDIYASPKFTSSSNYFPPTPKADAETMTIRLPPSHSSRTLTIPLRSGSSDLFSYLDHHRNLPTRIRSRIFSQIASAIHALHSTGHVHGDLKEENILIDATDPEWPQVKLCDFGHARRVRSREGARDGPLHEYQYYGTTEMTCPEMLKNVVDVKEAGRQRRGGTVKTDGFAADIWAMGLVLFSLSAGSLPSTHADIISGKDNIFQYDTYPCVYPGDMEAECMEVLDRCLTVAAGRRARSREVVRMPWVMQGEGGRRSSRRRK
ncbi:hypothetical protein HDV00_004569 [Rhizophlyctis rosea]|nr:hypothetical protein HDV00_004569 [Rhizophlyctis rosea]